jgi:hypothetical protein
MSDYEVPDPQRRWIYIGASIVFVVLIVITLITFSSARSTAQAKDKADQLIAALQDAGARAPSQDQIVRVLGEDGGAVCEDPGNALRRATLFSLLTNGAAGPGQRPIIADSRVVKGELLIVQIYCPEKLEAFKDKINDLDFDNVIRS